ncbi:phosphoribosylamine--glycine ligase [Taylorella equigenitalis]|uniref:Phosphoribosylamine--glycine ligase n=2 Tax=Taylorella equigenitalis TaxID=29575 RepID=A0A654KHZ4_TAYEM|nr:phosphoribosylamine--glycine ligase [Taylorella equigenitalis]ADU92057.1 Phosphoribosylamine--glycine ligase [Taylorella equigenitalis MCE9]AFN35619.1 phosphoribosylamine--glycine ligase [Taylorella equigenitalis ATCC 35865]ASY39043.1 phosphoribosylamine--glycine ligase [Taylorella equigenitalis]WDU56822.1 phosphoribosylamine--glycine ligase [Taylorella equigenitalis]VEG30656.1 Phosphoribosylamine--glycine ligase [Taylorella equigenitalis ATCC 35865]
MKILVIGSGGREHAIAWRLSKSPKVSKVYVAPGNGGIAKEPKLENIAITEIEDLINFANDSQIQFTVVGPEAPLAQGVVDSFRSKGLKIFGPTKAAAQLESSKDFAKQFMTRHNIPTASFKTFTDPQEAHKYLNSKTAPIVIKADGLAAGKGVVVASDIETAHSTVDDFLSDALMGKAGSRIVIEDFLKGEEASFIVMVDGNNILPLASSQDHKRLLDADKGPNTGGMGAYSPAPIVSDVIHNRVMNEIIRPTIDGLKADGIKYTGFLYAGLMIDDGPDETRPINVLEFNCRMGDPETQPIMMRIKSDFVDVVEAAIESKLDQVSIDWDVKSALGVVIAAEGYPTNPKKNTVINGDLSSSEDCAVFHAGTKLSDTGELVTNGGRVLCVCALGSGLESARDIAYQKINSLNFDGMQYRSDIGWRALKGN